MTPKIVKVERIQYFDYRPFTPSFMLVNQLEEEARRQERIQEEKEIKENRNNRGLFNFLLLPKRRRNEKWYEGYRAGAYDAIELCKHYFVGESISKDKLEKLNKFLHDEGITFLVNPAYFARQNKKMPYNVFTEINQELWKLYGQKIEFYKETEYGTC